MQAEATFSGKFKQIRSLLHIFAACKHTFGAEMTKLSVNINKIATLRNACGGNMPDVTKAAIDCETFGAEGITVHPRPDGRHIRYDDVRAIRPLVRTEFNIEGNPIQSFIDLVLETAPDQVTLVPDAENAITSDGGWDTIKHRDFLTEICSAFKSRGIRTSIFINADPAMAEGAARCGCDRVELYTGPYAEMYSHDREAAIKPFMDAAKAARECGIGLNAGHDLNLDNLNFFIRNIPWTDEVSIGHAIICDALYMGLQPTIQAYLKEIRNAF